MVKRLILKQRLDSAAAASLRDALAASGAEDIALDASEVEVLGGLCLELLMCASQVARATGQAFAIANPSEAFADNLARFGLTPDALAAGGAA